jgi:protein LTV1
VLEALEEEAFVDDHLDDGFFGDLIRDGERSDEEQLPYEFREEGIDKGKTGAQTGRSERRSIP